MNYKKINKKCQIKQNNCNRILMKILFNIIKKNKIIYNKIKRKLMN